MAAKINVATINAVANGWVVQPGPWRFDETRNVSDTHVFNTFAELVEWLEPLIPALKVDQQATGNKTK